MHFSFNESEVISNLSLSDISGSLSSSDYTTSVDHEIHIVLKKVRLVSNLAVSGISGKLTRLQTTASLLLSCILVMSEARVLNVLPQISQTSMILRMGLLW